MKYIMKNNMLIYLVELVTLGMTTMMIYRTSLTAVALREAETPFLSSCTAVMSFPSRARDL